MTTTSTLFMYSLTLHPPSYVSEAILGNFSDTKDQQIVAACGSRLTLYRPDPRQGSISPVYSHDVFGIIRSLAAFRLPGSTKDFIIIGSDSGRIAVVEYLPAQNRFQRLHLETFGKSGVRRVIPGQYLAADPKGRACLLASVEKNKVVYILNRNAEAEFTISSPLEANRPQNLVFALVALDVGHENPTWAALEVDYADSDLDPTGLAYRESEKLLVYYELDLGLNHVVRKWTEPVDRTAHLLFQVPGGSDGPSGVLVCAEGNVTWRHNNRLEKPHRVPIPRRKGANEDPARQRRIVSGVMHKMKGAFFFLLQSEDGDLFKINIDMEEDENGQLTGKVQRLKIKYFDTVPVATNLLILKSGFLFVSAQSGTHHFYQFLKLGDDEDESEFTSEFDPVDGPCEAVYFQPRPAENVNPAESIEAMHPMTSCNVANLTHEDTPQIYTACGAAARSTFNTLRHGLEVTELAESKLPTEPWAVWTVKLNRADPYDAYIILSFQNATLVLSIGEEIEEALDTGLMTSSSTLAIQLLGENALVQVHSRGLRHVRPGMRTNNWPAPEHRTVVAAATNESQVVVALSSGEIIYFLLDEQGSLAELEERVEMSGTVTSLSLGPVPEGRVGSSFLAVGCDDSTVRILSLEPGSELESKSVQALTSAPSALAIMAMADSASGGSTLYLHIGLHSGIYIRTVLDEITGELSDTRTRFLGARAVKLSRVSVNQEPCILATSTRTWLGYCDPLTKCFMMTPLNYDPLEWGWNFSSESLHEGMVGVRGKSLRIFNVVNVKNNMLQNSIPLAYTPRHMTRHPDLPLFYVAETENNVSSSAANLRVQHDPEIVNGEATGLPPQEFGYPRGKGHWASCIQVVDPVTDKKTVYTVDLDDDEAAVSIAAIPFTSQDNEAFLVVGTAKELVVSPRSHKGGFIHVYRLQDSGRSLEFIHKTKTEAPAMALSAFQGRLVAGIGTQLRMYDLGMKQLLRKAQAQVAPNLIIDVQTQGPRIIVSDVQKSAVFVVYKAQDNKLIPFADDAIPRWTTCSAIVDYETIVGGDKFGNLWMLRCPPSASDTADEEGSSARLQNERNYLHGAPSKLDLVAHYFPGDIPTSIQKCILAAGGREVLVWSGLQGTLGVLIPFSSREDAKFFQDLENHMRPEDPPLAGRDHLAYRSYYVPAKGVIDGDLCERFSVLSMQKKTVIAAELENMSVRDIERRIADVRMRAAF